MKGDEIILCEAVFDALTFCAHGFPNTTCLFGTESFTDELWEALRKVQRVKLAYDADEAGERAARATRSGSGRTASSLPRQVPARHGRQRIRAEGAAA
jgi:DNA primase